MYVFNFFFLLNIENFLKIEKDANNADVINYKTSSV